MCTPVYLQSRYIHTLEQVVCAYALYLHLQTHSSPHSLSSPFLCQAEMQRVQQMLENLSGDEANLEVKIENKRQELERNQKRLRSLANVR